MNLHKVERADFSGVISDTHKAVFGVELPDSFFRYDYALATTEGDNPLSYCLVKEQDEDSCEMTYGGTVSSARGLQSIKSFRLFVGFTLDHYKRVHIQVENKNFPMLKLALSEEFLVSGTRLAQDGRMFLLMTKEFGG
jgi:hypothetical protein